MFSMVYGLAFSVHLGLNESYNEIHPFVEAESGGVSVGMYLNSESNISPYLTYTLEHGGLFLEVGAVGGYTKEVLPYGRVGYHLTETTSIFAAPSLEDTETVGSVLAIQFTF